MDEQMQLVEPKPKKVFRLKKLIEDAQNFNRTRNDKTKTMIPQMDKKDLLSKFTKNSKLKTEAEDIEIANERSKKPVLQSQTTSTFYEIQGPQLKINKKFLSFLVKTGLVATESIDVYNNGSTAIYYEWSKVEKEFLISSSLKDNEERFYCHHKKNVIKPGETISFKFSFLSKVTGMFDEEWVLNCEPHLIEPLPKIKFSGQAIIDDIYIQWREDLSSQLDKTYIDKNIAEIVKDIVDNVRTPTPPKPDLENPEVCEREYEDKNYRQRLYYSSVAISFLRNMEQELYEEVQKDPQERYWDMNIEYIRKMINDVKEEENKAFFERKFVDIYQLSRFRPYHKSPIYYYMRDILVNLCKAMPDLSQTTRKECDMWEYSFKEPPEIDPTEDELKKKKDEEAKIKADWLKKSKKKKFTEDDEKKLVEDYRQKFGQKCKDLWLDQITVFENNDEYISIFQELTRKKRPDFLYFESLGKKKNLRDFDLDGKRVLLKVHLKLGQTKEAVAKKEEHESNIIHAEELRRLELERLEKERIEEEKRKKRGRGIVKKKNKKEEEEALRLAEEKKKLEEERKKEVPFLDPDNLEEILENLKVCLEKMAKLVILLVSYDKPLGKYSQIHSVKFFEEFLQNKIENNNILFSETTIIPDFLEKAEQDEYPDNSILILENAFFQPEEIGFRKDEADSMIPLNFEEKSDYIAKISEYAPIYVIEDKPNLFKKWTSLVALKPENCVLGSCSGRDLSLISYSMVVEKFPFVVIIGGDISPYKFLAIDSLLNIADEIWLVGKIGMLFKMYNEKIDSFAGLRLDEFKKKIIERVYKNIMDMNMLKSMPKSQQPNLKIAEIKIPCDIITCDLTNEEDEEIPSVDSPQFIEYVKNNQIYHNFLTSQEIYEFEEKEAELCMKEEQERILKEKLKEIKEDQYDEEYEEKNEEPQNSQNLSPGNTQKIEEKPFENSNIRSETNENPVKTKEEEEKKEQDFQKEGLFFVDFGSFTQRKIIRSIKNCKKLIWIDALCPNENPNFNTTDLEIAKFLYHYQQEKKSTIQKETAIEGTHDFEQDKIVFSFGKQLQQTLNTFDLIDPLEIKPTSQKDENEESKSQYLDNADKNEENKSQISGQGNPQENNKNNISLVSDFFSKDSDYACKIFSGLYPYGLSLAQEWEIKEGSEDEDNFSFLEEI